MAKSKCDKCGKERTVPPYMYGVYHNHEAKTLCRPCYQLYCKVMAEAENAFWETPILSDVFRQAITKGE